MAYRTVVVAEPGCTHEGSLDKLIELIDTAARADADAFKAQWCSDPEQLARRRNARTYLPFYRWLNFPIEWHAVLRARCLERGLQYACTAYLPQDVATIDPFVDFYKIAAFEARANDLRKAIVTCMSANSKRLVVSLGLGTADIRFSSDLAARTRRLRCVSAYPTPIDDLNLATLRDLDGLSDHTAADDPDSLLVGAIAVGAGATMIERHFRLQSCRDSNPDFVVSFDPDDLHEYVRRIRVAERALGSATVSGLPMKSERPMLRYMRMR